MYQGDVYQGDGEIDTRMQLTEELGISSSAIQRHIKILKEMVKIRRVGPDKGGYWEIIE